jgi:hypothetical protein
MNFPTLSLNNGNSSTAQVRTYSQPQNYNTVAQADFGRDPSTLADPMATRNYDGAGLSKEAQEEESGLSEVTNLLNGLFEWGSDHATECVNDGKAAIKQTEKSERHKELERRILSGRR